MIVESITVKTCVAFVGCSTFDFKVVAIASFEERLIVHQNRCIDRDDHHLFTLLYVALDVVLQLNVGQVKVSVHFAFDSKALC